MRSRDGLREEAPDEAQAVLAKKLVVQVEVKPQRFPHDGRLGPALLEGCFPESLGLGVIEPEALLDLPLLVGRGSAARADSWFSLRHEVKNTNLWIEYLNTSRMES